MFPPMTDRSKLAWNKSVNEKPDNFWKFMDWHERPAYFVHSTVNSISIGQFFGLKKYKEAKGGGELVEQDFTPFV